MRGDHSALFARAVRHVDPATWTVTTMLGPSAGSAWAYAAAGTALNAADFNGPSTPTFSADSFTETFTPPGPGLW